MLDKTQTITPPTTQTNHVWTHEARVYLYRALLDEVISVGGTEWNRHTWHLKGMRPLNVAVGTFNEDIFLKIYMDMRAKEFGMFPKRPPKSHVALRQQFQWGVTIQSTSMAPHKLRMQRGNRLAAYEAGFISMTEILFLEDVSAMRETTGL